MRRALEAVAIATLVLCAAGAARAGGPGGDSGFNFRLGGFFPTGHDDFWKANEAAFTLDHSDFDGLIGGVGYSSAINNYLEFGVGLDFYYESVRSADRAFVDQFGNPILHDTRLSLLPFTADLRVLPAGRFKSRGSKGQYKVRRPVPYIGGGIGLEYWEYEEEGDFVALNPTPTVVYDRLKTTGLAFEKHVMVGIELPVAPEWNLTFEARQSWADDTPGDGFAVVNPGKLDLGGTMIFVGGSLRF